MRIKPGPRVFVTVMFNDTASAEPGIPHWPARGKVRGTPLARGGAP
jgi:hypothetical protein